MSTKVIHVQAKAPDGSLVFDQAQSGKKYRRQLLCNAMLKLDEYAGIATLRVQELGVKGWAYYRYECRSSHCDYDDSIKWQ